MVSLLNSIGRCQGVGNRLSTKEFLFAGQAYPHSIKTRLDTPLNRGVPVDQWLSQHPQIRDAITWQHPDPLDLFVLIRKYHRWPDEDKDRLQNMVDLYAQCGMSNFEDPPPNLLTFDDDDNVFNHYFDRDMAKSWYFAHVAHSLTVEMGRWVPWSLTDYHPHSLRILLDSRSYFMWKHGLRLFDIAYNPYPPVVPARPRFTFEFMYKTDLIGNDRLDTILRMLEWSRWHLGHAGGDMKAGNIERYYGYRGLIPMRYMIEGDSVDDVHWTMGCHCTVGFWQYVFRSVNIPVGYMRRCRHGMPQFLHLDLFLSHADEPYNAQAERPDLEMRDLLIDETTFTDWFGSQPNGCPPGANLNVGRGLREAVAALE